MSVLILKTHRKNAEVRRYKSIQCILTLSLNFTRDNSSKWIAKYFLIYVFVFDAFKEFQSDVKSLRLKKKKKKNDSETSSVRNTRKQQNVPKKWVVTR